MASELSDPLFTEVLVRECEADCPVVLASLFACRGSMPRHEGARMALLADGSMVGTVGGGNIEFIATRKMQRVAAGSEGASVEWYTHERNAMACGGDVLLAVRTLTSEDAPVLRELLFTLERGGDAVVCEDWSCVEHPTLTLEAASNMRTMRWDEEKCVCVEPVAGPLTCHVFGAGHVGRALVPVLLSLGFKVRVYDDRPEMAASEFFEGVESIQTGDFSELADNAPLSSRDFVVVLTHGHRGDAAVLERVLRHELAYVGCIGSRKKAAVVRQSLVDAGISEEASQSLCLPIGEDILAVTPAEIAISIAAQLVRRRAEWRAGTPAPRGTNLT